jgi:predicted MPP superfamily phosphohydrolase
LQIVGVDWAQAANTERFRMILASIAIDREHPSILLKHEPKDLDVASERGISLQISGHTHRAQQWPLEYVARRVYNGYSYGLKNYREMLVYISSGAGTWGPPMRVGTDCEVVVFTFV